MNRLKDELIKDVKEMLVHHNSRECDNFVRSLHYFPEDNLQMILDCDVRDCRSFNSAYGIFRKSGALIFSPYVVQRKYLSNALCLEWNSFLHLRYGSYFMIMGSEDDRTPKGPKSADISFMISAPASSHIITESLLSYMLWWSAFLEVGTSRNNFCELFRTGRIVLEKFLNSVALFHGFRNYYGWSDVEAKINRSTGGINRTVRKVYDLSASTLPHLYYAVGNKTVQLESEDGKLYTLYIPEFSDGTNMNFEDVFEKAIYEIEEELLRERGCVKILLTLLISLYFIDTHQVISKEMRKKIEALDNLQVDNF